MPIRVPGKAIAAADLSRTLYESLILVRTAENSIIKYYPDDEMKTPMHMTMGQEAIPVGVCASLGDRGDVFCSYRSHGTFLARTKDVNAFFAELYGRATGNAGGKAGSMHLSDIDGGHLCSTAVVGTGIPIAVGTAFANRQLASGRITATFFGDGALDEGSFWESLNIACTMKIPVLFVCEDNGLAVHTGTQVRHGFNSITEVVRRFDCIVEEDDSNDVEAIHAITTKAAKRSLAESRPAFLRFGCFRYLEHVGINPDFDAGYRKESDYDAFLERDCIAIQRRRLLDSGMSESEIKGLKSAVEKRVKSSLEAARQAPIPDSDQVFVGVFHEKT